MAYIRKTRDYWEVQTFTGPQYGWECSTAEDTRKDARDRLMEYRENCPEYLHRIIKKRERIEALHISPTKHTYSHYRILPTSTGVEGGGI